MRIDLRLAVAKHSAVGVGSGFIALDVIEGPTGDRVAAGGTCRNSLPFSLGSVGGASP